MQTIHRVKTPFLKKIGRCGKCMRQSAQAMLAAWAALLGLALVPAERSLLAAAALAAAGFTALWLLHVAVFAVHWLARSRARSAAGRPLPQWASVAPAQVPALARPLTRRRLIGVFLAGLAAGAAVSFPRLARAACGDCAAAYGSGWLDCITNFCGTEGQVCCPPGYPYLNHCDCQCYDTTDMDCGSYSDCNYCG